MTKKHEELVESVAIYFQGYREECRFDPTIPDRSRDYAAKAITHILSAVRDGLSLPGEIDRGYFDDLGPANPVWDCYYIALRPLAGTGKEED